MKPSPPSLLLWDRDRRTFAALAEVLASLCSRVECVDSRARTDEALASSCPPDILIVDLATLLALDDASVARLQPPHTSTSLVVATYLRTEDYISDVRRLGLHHVLVNQPPFDKHELAILLESALDPRAGFSLALHFDHTMEMYSITAYCRETKSDAIERVINHFATNGFEIHQLYSVRLILEELVNNAFFHAFRHPDGTAKYPLSDFEKLDPGDWVRIEFGHASSLVGFAVTDNAGTLEPDRILLKMERQYKKMGLFDLSGRGLYISRKLATTLFFNLEAGRCTQIVAVFREGELYRERPRPLVINYVPPSAASAELPFTPVMASPPPLSLFLPAAPSGPDAPRAAASDPQPETQSQNDLPEDLD